MFLAASASAQEETSVLPKGIYRTWVIGAVGGADYQFNASGNKQGLAHILNRSVTMQDLEKAMSESKNPSSRDTGKELARLRNELNTHGENVVGLPNLGNSLYQADIYADAKVEVSQLVYALEYGLTTKVSLGLAVPLQWYDIKANLRIESQNSFLNTIQKIKNTPLENEIRRFAVEIQDSNKFKKSLFTDNGYQIPNDTRIFGVGDLEGGLKYRAFESQYVDAAMLFGFRLPTASHKKDPTNLLDQSTGDKQLDVAIQGGLDFKFTPNLVMLSAAKFTFQTPDREPIYGNLKGSSSPLPDLNDPRTFDNASRKLGNMWDLNFNLRYYMFQKRVALVGAYIYQHKFADNYSGNNPYLDYKKLELNTDKSSHSTEFFLVYSTVADYMRQEKAIPWEASITYHHTLAGRNVPDLRYGYARLKFFFN